MWTLHLLCLIAVFVINAARDLGELSVPATSPNDVNFEEDMDVQQEKVHIQLFYECLCPYCRDFDTNSLMATVEVLGPYLDVLTVPYGNAKMTKNGDKVEVKCQHGPLECYGNKLHACALKHISNHTEALFFNACMMDFKYDPGSDDPAAKECGKKMNIDVTTIINCANDSEGQDLLVANGKYSQKYKYKYVPYPLVNGVVYDLVSNFTSVVCKAFKNPPEVCKQYP